MSTSLRRIILIGAALFGAGALAQSTSTAPGSAPSRETLRALQREAARATLESRIKPEDRATYQKLQAELDAIRSKALALREKALRAYIADVQGGKTPEVARANANAAVAQEAAALQQARANLMSDARALVQKYPQLGRALNFDRPGEVLHSGRRDGRGGKFGMRLAPPYQKGFVKPQNRRR